MGVQVNRNTQFNRLLEENTVPAVWITNDIGEIDPAYIRRFDLVLEISPPPRSVMKKVIKRYCDDILDESTINELLESNDVTPALISRASEVFRHLGSGLDIDVNKVFLSMMNSTLRAQGHKGLRKNQMLPSLPKYKPCFANSSVDLEHLMGSLIKERSGRVCLYGPPGTGKTEFGKTLSEMADLPLHAHKVSDLISPYVGMSEQNIADAFSKAVEEEAILMIDEADSFLRDRRLAKNSWEVTLVNEMLTQIESFPGVLIVSSNLIDDLDQASLRRFDFKVKFDFLTHEQAYLLFQEYCGFLNIDDDNAVIRSKLSLIDNLTPGDFSTLARRARLMPYSSAHDFLCALKGETDMKESSTNHNPIGFIH